MAFLKQVCQKLAYNDLLIRQSLKLRRCFSGLPSHNTTSWTEGTQRCGRRFLSSKQQAASQEHSELIQHEAIPKSDNPLAPQDEEEWADWFHNRYTDKTYHAQDGLDPDEWLLIYRIDDKKQRDRLEYSLYGLAAGSLACGAFIFIITCIRRDDNPFRIAPAFILGGIFFITYATRLRRYGVLRLYTRRNEQEQWERWRLEQLSKPPSQRDVRAPIRHYRIVWATMFRKPQMFAYNSLQISDGVHRQSWTSRALNGNFLVLGRPWAVHPEFFDEPPDYIFTRRRG